jgi:IS30 family transposase
MKTYKRLTLEEREEISIGFAENKTQNQIAVALNREPSTISRELSRLRYNSSSYRASFAQAIADSKKDHSPITMLLERNEQLLAYVLARIRKRWSPQMIAERLVIEYPSDMDMRVSHETIYTYIYCRTRGELKKELISYLNQKRRHRGHRSRIAEAHRKAKIPNLVSIEERPKTVEDRIVPGHWEGDLIIGANHASALGTLVERTTRVLILVPLKKKDAESVARAFAREMKTLPEQLKQTLTYDRGSEMARHQLFTSLSKTRVYFCDPQSPWQRGSNESMNGRIRRFFPKGTDFNKVSRKEIKHVQDLLNGTPRKVLNYQFPYEAFSKVLSEKGEAKDLTLMLR